MRKIIQSRFASRDPSKDRRRVNPWPTTAEDDARVKRGKEKRIPAACRVSCWFRLPADTIVRAVTLGGSLPSGSHNRMSGIIKRSSIFASIFAAMDRILSSARSIFKRRVFKLPDALILHILFFLLERYGCPNSSGSGLRLQVYR